MPERVNPDARGDERGFSMIELLWVMAIIGILTALGWMSYYTYMDNAEYAKAEMTLRNARPAFEVAEDQLPPGFSMGLTFSGTSGGNVIGNLALILPGASVSPQVRLGAMFNKCDPNNSGAMIKEHLVSIPCKSGRFLTWTGLCNGVQIYQHNVAQGGGDTC